MKLLVYCRHTKIEPTSNSVNCSAYTFHVNIKKKKTSAHNMIAMLNLQMSQIKFILFLWILPKILFSNKEYFKRKVERNGVGL